MADPNFATDSTIKKLSLEIDESGQLPDLGQSIDPAAERSLVWKFDLRILPVLAVMYLFNSLDKSNLGNAKTAGLEETLNLKGNQYNLILSIFFIPYVLTAPFLGIAGKIYGPNRVLPCMMLSFGLCTLLVVAVFDFGGLFGNSVVSWDGRECFLPSRDLLPHNILPPRRTCETSCYLLCRPKYRVRFLGPPFLRRVPYQIRTLGFLALPLPHRGRRHHPLRRLRVLVSSTIKHTGVLPKRRGEIARLHAHATRQFRGRRRENQHPRIARHLQARYELGRPRNPDLPRSAPAVRPALPPRDHFPIGLRHRQDEPLHRRAQRLRRGHAPHPRILQRLDAMAVPLRGPGLPIHVHRNGHLCRDRRRARYQRRLLRILHDDLGNISTIRAARRLVQQQHRQRGQARRPDEHRRAPGESHGPGQLEYFPRAGRAEIHPRFNHYGGIRRDWNDLDGFAGGLDGV